MTEPVEVEVDGEVLSFEELRRRRGCVRIPNELLLRMTERPGHGWVVLGVHTDWELQSVVLMVANPSLPEVVEGLQPPDLHHNVTLWRDFRVIDGQVYSRSELQIEDPEVAASRTRAEVRAQLQAVVDIYARDATLDRMLAILVEEACARDLDSEFLESLR